MKRNRVIIMALRRMYSQGKGSVEKGLPSVEFSAVARYQNFLLRSTITILSDQLPTTMSF